MENVEKIEKLITNANNIRRAFNEWDNNYSNDSRCDKKRMTFNADDRFSACKGAVIRIDTWKGYYGDSGCSNILTLDENLWQKHLVKVLTKDFRKILLAVADSIEEEGREYQEAAKKELKEKLEKIESL